MHARLDLYSSCNGMDAYTGSLSKQGADCRPCSGVGINLLTRKPDHLVGLVVKESASRAEDPGFKSRLQRDFSWSSYTSNLKIGMPVATLPGAWRCRVSSGTGQHGVSII